MAYGRLNTIMKMTSNFRQAVGILCKGMEVSCHYNFYFSVKISFAISSRIFLGVHNLWKSILFQKELNQHKIVAITSNLAHVAEVYRLIQKFHVYYCFFFPFSVKFSDKMSIMKVS